MTQTRFGLLTLATLALVAASFTPARAQEADIVDTAVGAGSFKTLVAAVKAAGLVDTLKGQGPFTVFAPTDEAFANLPAGTVETLLKPENRDQLVSILTYHVLPGRVTARDAFATRSAATVNGQQVDIRFESRQLTIDEAKVLTADIGCSNGVIHVIDRVILPSQDSIPQVAEKAGSFKTLLAAVTTAELAGVLSQDGPFTVFAPTDEAFANLPEGTVSELLKPENRQQLVNILKYHVVSGRVFAADAVKAGRAKTLLGQSVRVSVDAAGPRVNEAALLTTDIDASNGVIHVIDRVLLPKAMPTRAAMELLEKAVRTGAPFYNHGDHRGCVRVYEQACRTLLDEGGSAMPETVSQVLTMGLRQASKTHHMGTKAWALRRGIDRAYTALNQADRMNTAVSR